MYSSNKILLFLIPIITVWVKIAYSDCSINIRSDLPTRDPVHLRYLNGKYDLWAPDGPSLLSRSGEYHLVSCTGATAANVILHNEVKSSLAYCISGRLFNITGNPIETINLDCRNSITGDTVNTGVSCPGGGTILNIGFNTVTYGFVTFVESCYNLVTGSVVYTRHVLRGRAIQYAVIESNRPSFKSAGTPSHVHPATSYTQASQLQRLTVLLGSSEQAAKFVYTNSYMARGHLAPDGDGIFRSWQFATYFYTNVAPEWQVVNAGNWLLVENAARTKSAQLQEDLLIFTGVTGILTLPHVNGQQIPITLEEGGNIEAPKWFWKIIKSAVSNTGIVLVTLNNPFVTSIASNEILCTNICASSGWANNNYNNFARGYTYCCEVNEFMRAVPGVPAEGATSGILYW